MPVPHGGPIGGDTDWTVSELSSSHGDILIGLVIFPMGIIACERLQAARFLGRLSMRLARNSSPPRDNKMKIASLAILTAALLLTGCASVNMAPQEESTKAKQFAQPSGNNAGLYIYRNSFVGKALKKDIWIDGKCLGESAPDVFFYTQVEGGKTHKIDTESEFSPNTLELMVEAGKNYFVRQYIKMGAFVGGAGVEQVSEEQGKRDIASLGLAQPGACSSGR